MRLLKFLPQENGHVKTNGDVSAKPEGEVAVADGNGTAEVVKETAEAGDAIEAADGEGTSAKAAEGEAPKETKKKKKFSLKNSFKFKGISLKKNKKSTEEPAEAAPAAAPEENGQANKETKEEEPAAEATEATAEVEAAPAPEAAEEEPKAEEPAPVAEATPVEESAKSEEVPASTPAEPEATPEATAEATPAESTPASE